MKHENLNTEDEGRGLSSCAHSWEDGRRLGCCICSTLPGRAEHARRGCAGSRPDRRLLIVSIKAQIEHLPFSRYYRGLQTGVAKLSLATLTDLKEMLNEVEQMLGTPDSTPPTTQCEAEEAKEDDDCPECNGAGEIFENEGDVSSCARCEGTGTLS